MIGRMLLMAIAIGIAQVAFTQIPNCMQAWMKVDGTEDEPTKCVFDKLAYTCPNAASTCQFSFRKWYYVCCQPDETGVFAASSVAGRPECCGPYKPVMGGIICTLGETNQCPYQSSCMESTNANITLCCERDPTKNVTGAVC
uniref:Uncharacterized protein n=1 Tax=Plectus sambesii TaxID=2011161 RepID=A0A914W8S6_9BILA